MTASNIIKRCLKTIVRTGNVEGHHGNYYYYYTTRSNSFKFGLLEIIKVINTTDPSYFPYYYDHVTGILVYPFRIYFHDENLPQDVLAMMTEEEKDFFDIKIDFNCFKDLHNYAEISHICNMKQ